MPYFKIETNKMIDKPAEKELLKKASVFIATLLGKPEKWIMVSLFQSVPVIFDGNADFAAYLELKSIGLAQDKCADFSQKLCDFITAELGISSGRIYIEFWDINGKMFGWNGGTF